MPADRNLVETLFGRDSHPGMSENPEKWEKSWERDLKLHWDGPRSVYGNPAAKISLGLTAEVRRNFNPELSWQEIYGSTHDLVRLQTYLGEEAVQKVVLDNFDSRWRAQSDAERRKIILQGICRAMRRPGLHRDRMYCPDSTLTHLASANGEGYLKILHFLLPDDTHQPLTEPKFIPHPDVDRYLSAKPNCSDRDKPIYDSYVRFVRIGRSNCLTNIIRETLFAFYNIPYRETSILKPSREGVEAFGNMTQIYDALGVDREAYLKDLGATRKEFPEICTNCNTHEDKEHGIHFRACSKCRKIGRLVLYCSEKCQVYDWKFGIPRPHKQICGRPLDADALKRTVADTSPKFTLADFQSLPTDEEALKQLLFPPPRPGYRRSPALVYQLGMLKENRDVDYMAPLPAPAKNHLAIEVPDRKKSEFLYARSLAFSSGDPASVQKLFNIVCEGACVFGSRTRDIKEQMEKEFPGVQITDFPRERLAELLTEEHEITTEPF